MKTKIIPFDLETAKKIQAGEIEGRIVTTEGDRVRIVCFDREGFKDSILALITIDDSYEIDMFYTSDGKASKQSRFDIHIEVPDNEPQFKPFDKVLMRSPSSGYVCWYPHFYCRYIQNAEDKKPYVALDGFGYEQCIPYEGNEHLVGTTGKPKED